MLSQRTVVVVDCQTTGMRPPRGQVIEISWLVHGERVCDWPPEAHLVCLPEASYLPKKVEALTGISPEMLGAALDQETVFRRFHADLLRHRDPLSEKLPLVVIHYAQFEKPFLEDLYQRFLGLPELPFEVLCTHRIAKKVLLNLPTMNLQGLSGYFGMPLRELKRSLENVLATALIWQGLVEELRQRDILSLEELRSFLGIKAKASGKKYEYPLLKEKRLGLPDRPGVYRMIAKTGEVLYVGKATSLKDRVNSYFRGQKGRDRRKLEMLVQVWDIRVTVCENPVMAAILENDEIKRLNPKYNISLKTSHRKLIFYDRYFEERSIVQDLGHPIGPFRSSSPIEQLRSLRVALGNDYFQQIFYEPVPLELVREGFLEYCAQKELSVAALLSVRSMLAHGLLLSRFSLHPDEVIEDESEDEEYTVADVVEKFRKLFVRAAQEYLRSKKTNELLNAKVSWFGKDRQFEISIVNGRLTDEAGVHVGEEHPWNQLSMADYDRLMILQSEMRKYQHEIQLLE